MVSRDRGSREKRTRHNYNDTAVSMTQSLPRYNSVYYIVMELEAQ
jgi:hypothetical protein